MQDSETRTLRRISFVVRILVTLNWAAVLSILAIHDVSKTVALGAFTVFKITAVVGTLWLVAEFAEVFAGRIRLVEIIWDSMLIMPMFAFWFLVAASTF